MTEAFATTFRAWTERLQLPTGFTAAPSLLAQQPATLNTETLLAARGSSEDVFQKLVTVKS